MTERVFKQTERDFWLYPKLLLVVIGGFVITAVLQRWLSDSAVTIGLLPFFVLFGFMGRPVTYRQWFQRVLILLAYLLVLLPVLLFARPRIHVTWNLKTALLGIVGGSALFAWSLNTRWARWCDDKPFFIPAIVLFAALWLLLGGLFHLATLPVGW